jgi:hypothetical protein
MRAAYAAALAARQANRTSTIYSMVDVRLGRIAGG